MSYLHFDLMRLKVDVSRGFEVKGPLCAEILSRLESELRDIQDRFESLRKSMSGNPRGVLLEQDKREIEEAKHALERLKDRNLVEQRKQKQLEEQKIQEQRKRLEEQRRRLEEERLKLQRQNLLKEAQGRIEQIDRQIADIKQEIRNNEKNSIAYQQTIATLQSQIHQQSIATEEWKLKYKEAESRHREAQTRAVQESIHELYARLKALDNDKVRKYRGKELNEAQKLLDTAKSHAASSDFDKALAACKEGEQKTQAIQREYIKDIEKYESQKAIFQAALLVLRDMGYRIVVSEKGRKDDPRSPVIIKAEQPSGLAATLSISFEKEYYLSFNYKDGRKLTVEDEKEMNCQDAIMKRMLLSYGIEGICRETDRPYIPYSIADSTLFKTDQFKKETNDEISQTN